MSDSNDLGSGDTKRQALPENPANPANGDGGQDLTDEGASAGGQGEGDAATRCPYCAEQIRAEAIRCPHCRSRLNSFDRQGWHRDHPEARVAGVAAAISHVFHVPVTVVRLGFVMLTFMHLLGPILYVFGWLAIPQTPERGSLAEAMTGSLGSTLRHERRQMRRRRCGGRHEQDRGNNERSSADDVEDGKAECPG